MQSQVDEPLNTRPYAPLPSRGPISTSSSGMCDRCLNSSGTLAPPAPADVLLGLMLLDRILPALLALPSLPDVGSRGKLLPASASASLLDEPSGGLEWNTAGGAVMWVAGVDPRVVLMSPLSGAESNLGTLIMALSSAADILLPALTAYGLTSCSGLATSCNMPAKSTKLHHHHRHRCHHREAIASQHCVPARYTQVQ